MRARYESEVVDVAALDEQTIADMAELYLDSYDGSSRDLFRHDLVEKDRVVLVRTGACVVGFTAIKTFTAAFRGRQVRVVFSGDTVVARRHWGQQQLAFTWLAHVGQLRALDPSMPLYWFLLVKGHRTYRYLSAFARSFFPHWRNDRSDLKPLADRLAAARYGAAYNPATGVIEFSRSRGHLREELAEPAARELTREDVSFFLARNPGYRRGHELVCICELEIANLKPLTARVFQPGGPHS